MRSQKRRPSFGLRFFFLCNSYYRLFGRVVVGLLQLAGLLDYCLSKANRMEQELAAGTCQDTMDGGLQISGESFLFEVLVAALLDKEG